MRHRQSRRDPGRYTDLHAITWYYTRSSREDALVLTASSTCRRPMMFSLRHTISDVVLAELVLREMRFDARNRPHLQELRPILRKALKGQSWASDAIARGIPLDTLKRASLSLQFVFWSCGAAPPANAPIAAEATAAPPAPAPEMDGPLPASESAPVVRAGRPPKLSDAQRAEVSRLRAQGSSNAEIARALGVSRSTISRI